MTYTYSKDHHVENDHRNILVRAWLAWEELIGKILGPVISRKPDGSKSQHDPFSFFDMLKSTVRTRKRLAITLTFFIILPPLAYLTLRYALPARAVQWWPDGGASWSQRKQLTVTNNSAANLSSGTTVAITLDTSTLVSTGKVQSDCDDLRILYQPSSSTTTEVARHLIYPVGTTCTTSTATKVYFKLQAALNAGVSSADYYTYYNNAGATTPSSTDAAFNVGSADATLVCPFDGSTTCAAGETPSTETGAVRYSGSKGAMSFDGVNDSVSSAGSSSLSIASAITIEFWMDPSRTPVGQGDYGIVRSNYGSDGFLVETRGDNKITVWLKTANNAWSSYLTSTSTFSNNTWTHVVVTYSTGNLKLYFNGVLDKTITTVTGDISYGGNPAAVVGNWGGTQYFPGYIDEVRLSNIVRYTSNFTPQTTPFVRDSNTALLLHMDENGDDPRNTGKAIDDSGNANHGTITGAKYVAGLVGVDGDSTAPSSWSGTIGSQSYAKHE